MQQRETVLLLREGRRSDIGWVPTGALLEQRRLTHVGPIAGQIEDLGAAAPRSCPIS